MMKMKRWMFVAALLLALLPALGGQGEEVSAEELKRAMAENPYTNVLDVRSTEEFLAGAVSGADNMPLDQMEATLKSILEGGFDRMDTVIYVYGATKEQGEEAERIFRSAGFTNVFYLASLDSWEGKLADPTRILGDLNTQDIYAKAVDESILEGKKLVMVNVWGTFCNPCIGEMTDLGRLANDMADQGVQLLGLVIDCNNDDFSIDEEQAELARTIAESTGASYPHLLPNAMIYRNVLAQIQAVPTTFFLDSHGHVTGQVQMGARDYDAWKQIVEETLASLPQ